MIKQEFNFLIHLFNWLGSFRRDVNIPIAVLQKHWRAPFFSWLHDIKTHHQWVVHNVRLWFIWQQRWTRSCASFQLRWKGDEHLITKRTSCTLLVLSISGPFTMRLFLSYIFLTHSVFGIATHSGTSPAKKKWEFFAYLCLFVVCFSPYHLSTCTAIANLCSVVIWRCNGTTWVAVGKCRRRWWCWACC